MVLITAGFSGSTANGVATMMYSTVTAATPNTPGASSLVEAVSGDHQSGPVGTMLGAPVVLAVVDSYRNFVPGATVTFAATNATVSTASAQTDASGRASAQVTLGPVAGAATVTAAVAGLPPVTLHFTATANASMPIITGVVNGASFQPSISAGGWVTVQGTNLSATTRQWGDQDFVNGALPVKLDNVSVTINGKSAYVYFISPKQLNVLAPADAALGPVAVQITNSAGTSAPFTAMKLDLAPALFPFTARYPAAVHTDASYVGPANLIPGAVTRAAQPKETILLFGTSFGATTPATPIGMLFPNAEPLAQTVTATVGGSPAAITGYLISPGLYQFNLVVPDLPDGDAVLVISIGSARTPDGLFLALAKGT